MGAIFEVGLCWMVVLREGRGREGDVANEGRVGLMHQPRNKDRQMVSGKMNVFGNSSRYRSAVGHQLPV